MDVILNYHKPATKWSEGCLLGNGFMGQVIYGGIDTEIIELSEASFFSGAETDDIYIEDANKYFKLMRKEALLENDAAVKEYTKSFMAERENFGTNLPVGKIRIEFNSQGSPQTYSRKLALNEGICEVNYTTNTHHVLRESFSSNKDRIFAYRIQETSESGLDFILALKDMHSSTKVFSDKNNLFFSCTALEDLHSDGLKGTNLYGVIHICLLDGQVIYRDNEIHVVNTHDAIILLAMDTDYTLDKKNKVLDFKYLQKLVLYDHKDYNNLKLNHLCNFKKHMSKQFIYIEGDEKTSRMHQFGRYLLLSSSRENSVLPAHLQGVWNDNVACNIGWTCDMHLDINTQMNYWISEAGNLSDSHMPLFHWLEERVIPNGRNTAKKCYGINGWVAELVSNSRGYSGPYWNESLSPCPASGIWMASHYMEHYRFTGDKIFLQNNVYPVLKEAVQFFREYIFLNQKGYYVSGPSISPENAFIKNNNKYYASIGPTFEILMIRELFKDFIEVSQILEKIGDEYAFVVEVIERLLPYQIDELGQIKEWNHSYQAYDLQHRHTSHLLGLFPYHQIDVHKTPDLAKAAQKTIEAKMTPYDNWEDTGWARNLLILYSARLHQGDLAYEHIKALQNNLTGEGLLVMHPPTRGAYSFSDVYELDGNTGFAMAVIEMLVQCFDSVIHLLPALPKEWNKGRAKGISLRGGINLDLAWDQGLETTISVISKEDRRMEVRYQNTSQHIELFAGVRSTFNWRIT